jgi:hypothetical protein
MQIPECENQEIFKNLNLTDKNEKKNDIINSMEDIENTERRFDFKIKVIQTDLTPNDDFHSYFKHLNESNVPFMVQHSGYIEKLNRMNRFDGGTLSSPNLPSEYTGADRYFGGVFQADIANPDVLAEIERKKEKMLQDMMTTRGTPENFLKDLIERLADGGAEEWEFEDVDIPGNLYMFDMINGHGNGHGNGANHYHYDDDYEDDDYHFQYEDGDFDDEHDYDEEYEEYEDYHDHDEFEEFQEFDSFEEKSESDFNNNKFEVKFSATGSIKFLENNILEVKYDESDMTGIKNAFVRFLFNFDEKDFITIHRFGHSDTWLNCEKGERISGTGKIRSHGSSITVDTKEIINNMTPDGGQLVVSYIKEMNGTPSEMVTHVISASPSRE